MSQSEASEPPSNRLGVIVLAAGQGTRMRSHRPKVLHPVAGRPMVAHVLDVARALNPVDIVVVVGPESEELRPTLNGATIVEQTERLGTGHAVQQAHQSLAGAVDRVLVLYGDTPLIRLETILRLLSTLDRAAVAVLTAELANPSGYGRIVRELSDNGISRIVEEAEASPDILSIREVNSGLMAFDAQWLWAHLPTLPLRPKGEYYLTDLVEMALQDDRRVSAVQTDEPAEALGINTQAELAVANRLAWDRASGRLMAAGVTIIDPATTYVEPHVQVGPGTIIHPNTHLQGTTRIGQDCEIGPNSSLIDSTIGDGCRVWASVVEGSEVEHGVRIGPFSHLRPGCYVESGAELGNFAEAKASRIGQGTQVHHFSYLGDAHVGSRVNVGAGTITCNYDGRAKHRTIVGQGAFLGSDTLLIAPVTVGVQARTGAGSVVTHDVPDQETVVGVPARPLRARTAESLDSGTQKDGE